jgi:SAM-dependent methyltransferase
MSGAGGSAEFHNQLAAEYDARLTSNPYDVLARAAFVDLVARYVPAGSTLLDFGCGTGLDAHEYARRGYRVLAYDNSPGMIAELERRCQAEIASGAITPYAMDYSSFLNHLPQWPAPQAVVSNFAVLNLIPDLESLFDTLAQCLEPPGWVIVSILNPIHWSKLKAPRAIYLTQPYACYLHFVPAVLRAARRFRMVGRANAGKCVRYDSTEHERLWWGRSDSKVERMLWHTAAHKLLGHFVFLVLRRDA